MTSYVEKEGDKSIQPLMSGQVMFFAYLCRLLFPELPNEEYVLLHTDTVSGVTNHGTEESLTSSMLMHPLLFPRLFPPLFTLYALENERADSAYWERIQQLNKRSDWALMTYVGMQRYEIQVGDILMQRHKIFWKFSVEFFGSCTTSTALRTVE